MEGQEFQLVQAAMAAAVMVAVGMMFVLPDLQRLIEQQRTQRAREREFLRRARAEIEA